MANATLTRPTPSAPSSSLARRRALLSALLVVSLIPALLLAVQRLTFEFAYRTVAVVMDYNEAHVQAQRLGLTDAALLNRYRKLGVDAMAVDEMNLNTLIQRDEVLYREGNAWRTARMEAGRNPAPVRSDRYYLRSLVPGVAEAFQAKYSYLSSTTTIDGQQWIVYPVGVGSLLAGPDLKEMRELEAMGFFIVYRPGNALQARHPGADFPKVRYIVYTGDDVTGFGDDLQLEKVAEHTRAIGAITGVFESVYQKGLNDIAKTNPVIRVFSLRPEWQQSLKPEETASKFVLAARERNHRLLYVRPYNRIDDTETFLQAVNAGLEKADMKHGQPGPLEYQPNPILRLLSLAGPLLALALLVTTLPFPRLGLYTALGLVGLCVVGGGLDYGAPALLAAVVFPTLGFALYRSTPRDWLRATAITVMGCFFVAGLGAGRDEVLALAPFRGVALTLVLPPLLLALTMLPRQDIRKTVRDLWDQPITYGNIGLALIGLMAVGLILARRGNTPAVGTSATEAEVRLLLQDSMIRPRTKEVLLHPIALLALGGSWPVWFGNLLLLAGVLGQGSIVDTFAHFHTPLIISLQRTVNGLAIGLLIGLALIPVAAYLRRLVLARPAGSRPA